MADLLASHLVAGPFGTSCLSDDFFLSKACLTAGLLPKDRPRITVRDVKKRESERRSKKNGDSDAEFSDVQPPARLNGEQLSGGPRVRRSAPSTQSSFCAFLIYRRIWVARGSELNCDVACILPSGFHKAAVVWSQSSHLCDSVSWCPCPPVKVGFPKSFGEACTLPDHPGFDSLHRSEEKHEKGLAACLLLAHLSYRLICVCACVPGAGDPAILRPKSSHELIRKGTEKV